MCDYSLHLVASRPAKVGDKLVTTAFNNSLTRGFAAVGEPHVAVCLLPGRRSHSRPKSNASMFLSFFPGKETHRAEGGSLPADQHGGATRASRRVGSPTGKSCCSPNSLRRSTRDLCCSHRLLRAPRTKRSSRSAVLWLPDRAARYRACLAVGTLKRAIGVPMALPLSARGNKTALSDQRSGRRVPRSQKETP